MAGRPHFSEHLPGKYLERLALCLSRVQRLCADPRESRRLAVLLSANPVPSTRSHASLPASARAATRSGARDTSARSAVSPPAKSAQRTSSRSAAGDGGGGDAAGGAGSGVLGSGESERQDGSEHDRARGNDSPAWSSVRTGTELSGEAVSPVVFGDVLQAFCSADQDGYGSDHDAVASAISEASHAADSPAVMLGHIGGAARSTAGAALSSDDECAWCVWLQNTQGMMLCR